MNKFCFWQVGTVGATWDSCSWRKSYLPWVWRRVRHHDEPQEEGLGDSSSWQWTGCALWRLTILYCNCNINFNSSYNMRQMLYNKYSGLYLHYKNWYWLPFLILSRHSWKAAYYCDQEIAPKKKGEKQVSVNQECGCLECSVDSSIWFFKFILQ